SYPAAKSSAGAGKRQSDAVLRGIVDTWTFAAECAAEIRIISPCGEGRQTARRHRRISERDYSTDAHVTIGAICKAAADARRSPATDTRAFDAGRRQERAAAHPAPSATGIQRRTHPRISATNLAARPRGPGGHVVFSPKYISAAGILERIRGPLR